MLSLADGFSTNIPNFKVLVFNCDEGIDVRAIGRIFVGPIQCGAWGCFDEFNRLGKGVLSAVSSQVQLIQEASRANDRSQGVRSFGPRTSV